MPIDANASQVPQIRRGTVYWQGCVASRGGIYVKNSEILVIFFVYLAGVVNVDVCVCGVIPHRPAPGSGFFTHPGGLLITQGVY